MLAMSLDHISRFLVSVLLNAKEKSGAESEASAPGEPEPEESKALGRRPIKLCPQNRQIVTAAIAPQPGQTSPGGIAGEYIMRPALPVPANHGR